MSHMGVFNAIGFGLSTAGSLASDAVSTSLGERRTLQLCTAGAAAGLAMTGWASSTWAAWPLVSGSFLWGVQWPVVAAMINSRAPGGSRATVVSLAVLARKGALASLAPAVAWVLDGRGADTALVFCALALLLGMAPLGRLSARAGRRHGAGKPE